MMTDKHIRECGGAVNQSDTHASQPRDADLSGLADALEKADWSGVSIGNKVMLKGAIDFIRQAAAAHSGEGAGEIARRLRSECTLGAGCSCAEANWQYYGLSCSANVAKVGRAILASPPPVTEAAGVVQAAPAWQPIKTAPKDGTLVLITGIGKKGWFIADAVWDGEWMLFDPQDDAHTAPCYAASHWMPLPAFPDRSSRSSTGDVQAARHPEDRTIFVLQEIARGRCDNGRPLGGEVARQMARSALDTWPGRSSTEGSTIDDVPSCGQENDYRRARPSTGSNTP